MEMNPYAPPPTALVRIPAQAAGAGLNPNTALFFPVSSKKLVLLCLASFGLYQAVWFYKNWVRVKDRGEDVYPLARMIFGGLFCFGLFRRMRDEARSRGVELATDPASLAIAWILLIVAGRLADLLWLVPLAGLVPLLDIQQGVNEVNRREAPAHNPNARFTAANIVVMVIGFPLLFLATVSTFLAFVGTFLPDP